jgi:predicted ATP-dependent serine protease
MPFSSKMSEKHKYVCDTCGSSRVRAEGECEWNINKQAWEIVEFYYDRDYCMECLETVRTDTAPLDLKDIAQLAINKGESNDKP